jgi:hypothetical protein
MQIADDIKDDIKAARKMRLRLPWWGVLCAIIGGLPIVWLFDHFGKFNLFFYQHLIALRYLVWPLL